MELPRLPADSGMTAVVFHSGADDDAPGRVQTAIELVDLGVCEHIVFVGGWRPDSGRLGSKRMSESARMRGIPIEKLSYDEGFFDSLSNLAAICGVFESTGWHPENIVLELYLRVVQSLRTGQSE